MKNFVDYVLLLLTQFAGGPGPKENNLVRFALPAILWAILLVVAWSRQRTQDLPRERLLVWGFGLALARELFMFSHVSSQLIWGGENPIGDLHIVEPLEHTLTMAAVVMVAGAFLRYLLDDELIARRYLQVGLATTLIAFVTSWWWWSVHLTSFPQARFNQSVAGLAFHLMIAAFAAIAMALLSRGRGWLRNVVWVALGFFVIAGILRLWNYVTNYDYTQVFCPICNSLHILAIPLLGYVYLREQSIEKRVAEDALEAYRDHLEVLVEERTAELTTTNEQLQSEIAERKLAEVAIARRNTELAAQNAIAATLSRSMDLDTVLDTALDTVLSVLEMEAGCIYLLEPDGKTLRLRTRRGDMLIQEVEEAAPQPCSCAGISWEAVTKKQPFTIRVDEFDDGCQSAFVRAEGLRSLASTPLVSKGRALGALSLGTKRVDTIPEATLDLLTGIGQQIGMVVENAHLYKETEYWANELTMLHQVSVFLSSTLEPDEIYRHIAEQSAKIVGCESTVVFHLDRERREAVAMASYGFDEGWAEGQRLAWSEHPFLSELVSNRQTVSITDAQANEHVPREWREDLGIRGLLCVPVLSTEDVSALLFLMDRRKARRWRPTEIELVESFVNRAAVSLENAYLHKQLEWAAALEERHRIAAEMHDGLAQTLSYIALRTFNATQLLEEGQVEDALAEHTVIEKTIAQAVVEVRRSIASLQESPSPRRPLQDWVLEVVDEHLREGGPPTDVDVRLAGQLFLPRDQNEQVLRVLKEALLNVRHHAEAGSATVRLERRGEELLLTVEDDGQGFDPMKRIEDDRGHFGLSIMRARAARIGGRIEVDSAPGEGTRLALAWPMTQIKASNGNNAGSLKGSRASDPAS